MNDIKGKHSNSTRMASPGVAPSQPWMSKQSRNKEEYGFQRNMLSFVYLLKLYSCEWFPEDYISILTMCCSASLSVTPSDSHITLYVIRGQAEQNSE